MKKVIPCIFKEQILKCKEVWSNDYLSNISPHTTNIRYLLTNKTSIVPKFANSLFTAKLLVDNKAEINFVICNLANPRGGSSIPAVVLTAGFCKEN